MATQPSQYTFLPCPFCGGAAVVCDNVGKPSSNDHAFVRCADCQTDGPEKGTVADAVDAWNTREPGQKADEWARFCADLIERGETLERASIVAWLLRWRFEDPVKTAIRDEFIRSIERGDHVADAIARRELGA